MGGRHSDQGFADNVDLLTLNPYRVDGMKDAVDCRRGVKRTGEKGQMCATTETRASWDGLCLAHNGEQILEGGGRRPRKPRHKTTFVAIVFPPES